MQTQATGRGSMFRGHAPIGQLGSLVTRSLQHPQMDLIWYECGTNLQSQMTQACVSSALTLPSARRSSALLQRHQV